jgi:hypothetical protein
MGVTGPRHETGIFDRTAYCKVIETLELKVFNAKETVKGIVEVAANSRAADACGLRLEVQNLAEQTRLPEEPAIPSRSLRTDSGGKLRKHPKAKRTRGCDLLPAADRLCHPLKISGG